MRKLIGLMTTSLLISMAVPAASGATILQNTGGTLGVVTNFFGESFTTPAGGPWSNITFNFFSDIPATTPTAAGTAFLLTQEYLGTPASLNSSVPGFLAASTSVSSGHYNFDPTLVLQTNTKYFLYENASLATSGGNAIAGGNAYFAVDSTTNFAPAPVLPPGLGLQAANFLLSGTPTNTAVPEPTSLLGSLIGLSCLLCWRFKRGIAG
jgi:hypothetical protein